MISNIKMYIYGAITFIFITLYTLLKYKSIQLEKVKKTNKRLQNNIKNKQDVINVIKNPEIFIVEDSKESNVGGNHKKVDEFEVVENGKIKL